MSVRLATQEDAEAIAFLNREVQQMHADAQPHLFKQPGDLEPFKADIRDRMLANEDGRVLIAEDDGHPVGYVYLQFICRPENAYTYARRFVHIDQISVKSECRKTGAGRALIEAVFELARRENIERITLDTWNFNENARIFFAHMGFNVFNYRMDILLTNE